MWLNGKFTDLTITCQGRIWKAHRVVLASRCKFFETCCKGEFEVRRRFVSNSDSSLTPGLKEAHTQTINMDKDPPIALDHLLRYLYTMTADALPVVENHKVCEKNFLLGLVQLFVLADKYGQGLLQEMLLTMLEKQELSCKQCRADGKESCTSFERYPEELLLAYEATIDLPDTDVFNALSDHIMWLCCVARKSFAQWCGIPKDATRQTGDASIQGAAEAREVIAKNPEVAIRLLGIFALAADTFAKPD